MASHQWLLLTSITCCQNQSDMFPSSVRMKDCEGLNPNTLRRLEPCYTSGQLICSPSAWPICNTQTSSNIFGVSRKDIIASEMVQIYIVQLSILLLSIKTFLHKLFPVSKGVYCLTLTDAL
jgi:hypothetical protein